MSQKISVKVDVTKLLKEHFFKGKKGLYADLILIPTPDSEYGNFMVVQDLPRELRDSGVKGPILGNAKYLGQPQQGGQATARTGGRSGPPSQVPSFQAPGMDDDSIPF